MPIPFMGRRDSRDDVVRYAESAREDFEDADAMDDPDARQMGRGELRRARSTGARVLRQLRSDKKRRE